MRLDTTMTQRMDQRMILAPRMIQSMEILQLPIMALQERIQQELQENPVLELVIDETGDNQIDFDRLEALSRDWEDHFNEEHRPSRSGLDEEGDKKHDAMQNMPSRPQSLQDYLSDQLAFLDTTPEQLRLLRYLITHIDENGWLTASLDELAKN